MPNDVDLGALTFKIASDSSQATKDLRSLRDAIGNLNKKVGEAQGYKGYADGISYIARAASSLKSSDVANISNLTTALAKLNKLKIPEDLSSRLQGIKEVFGDFRVADASGLVNIANSAAAFSGQDFSGLVKFGNSLSKALPEMEKLSGLSMENAVQNIATMRDAAAGLSEIQPSKGFNSTINSLTKVPDVVSKFDETDTETFKQRVNDIADAVGSSGLQAIEKSGGFNSTLNSLKKVPEIFEKLENVDVGAFADRIREVADAVRPLATEMEKVSAGFANFPTQIEKATAAGNRFSGSVKGFGLNVRKFLSYAVLVRAAHKISELVEKSTQYTENVNLFTVAMGKYADEAMRYAETVSNVMGIDVSDWIREQGVFQTLATGFGVASDRAAIMSKNLTQLAYDLSSFYNLDIADSMQKLESGFAGEIEPVRRLGYDLSKTALQAAATDLGITKLYKDMTQAEKSQLRYYVLMTQVTQVQGDMARTLQMPANQLRILKAQLEMAGRSIGNVFIPFLNMALPYLIAFAKMVRFVADQIASFFGFSLPEVDYSGINTGIGDITDDVDDLDDSLDNAAGSAKKLKNLLASFDELNIIASESGGSGGGAGSGLEDLVDGWKDFELPEYDFLSDVLASKADKIFENWKKKLDKLKPILKWIRDNFDKIWQIIKAIGVAFASWKIASGITRMLSNLGWMTGAQAGKITLGLTFMVTGYSLEFGAFRAIGAGDTSAWNWIKAAIGSALGIAGSLLVFGTGPVGWVVGIGLTLAIAVTGFVLGRHDQMLAEMEQWSQDILDTFEGTIDPNDYIKVVQDKFNSITFKYSAGIEIKNEVTADFTSLSETLLAIDNYRLKLEGTGQLTDDEIAQMNLAFKSLYDEGYQYIDKTYQLLEDGLLNALRILPEETQTAVKGYLTELGVLETDTQDQLTQYINAYETALQNAADAAGNADLQQKYLNAALIAKQAIAMLTGAYVDGERELERLKNEQGLSIDNVNFTSIESIQSYLEGVAGAYSEAKATINEYYAGVIDTTQAAIDAAELMGDTETAQKLSGMLTVYREAWAAEIQNLDSIVDEDFVPVVERIRDGIGSTFNKMMEGAADDWNSLPWIDKFLLYDDDETKYYAEKISAYAESVVKPFETAIGNALGNMGKDFTPDASSAIERTLDAYQAAVQQYAATHNLSINSKTGLLALEEMGYIDYYDFFREMFQQYYKGGSGAANAFSDGFAAQFHLDESEITDGFDTSTWGFDMANGLIDSFKGNINGMAPDLKVSIVDVFRESVTSPMRDVADAAAESGLGTGSAFGQGILSSVPTLDNNVNTALDAVKTPLNNMTGFAQSKGREAGAGYASSLGDEMARKLKTVGQKIGEWWSRFALPVPRVAANNGSSNPSDWLNVPIPAFASGGYPRAGSLFIAGERGAELVGSMGGSTAVANGDQIANGIANGVAAANETQNTLLREQNAILREILATGGNVVFTPTAEAGQAVQRALNMYAVQRGY